MQCRQCNKDNPQGAKFCLKCGTKLVAVCPKCGTELPPDSDSRFCVECGSELGALEPAAPLHPPESIPERVRRLVPKEYAERLLATRGQVQAERRMVTILFSDVKGSTAMAEDLDPEDVMEIMEGAFDVLIEPVYRYEGTLARLMGDAVLAFFGAPIAHEDDPERACRAALEIVEGAKGYAAKLEQERGIGGFNVRVGINTGLVVVGEVGSDVRVEYSAMGDAINLAARMEQNAPPGGILITHDTYRHVRGVFDVLRQEPLGVKGRRQPVQTYLVEQAKPRAFRKGMRGVEGIETRMIGRRAQLDLLQEAFYTAMEDGELHMATIVGEAGVGKSRLLHEFDIWSELLPERFWYFKGRASQQMHNLPYSLIRDLFAFRFQIQDSDPLAVVRQKLEGGVAAALGEGEESQMRAHFIGHLLGFELGESPHLARAVDDAKQVHERGLRYVADYFKGLASQQPVLILLEDLHWADDSSLDALNELALALTDQPLMVVSTARPELYEGRPHWGEGQPFHTRLHLRPLSKRNARLLVDEILQRVETVPATLRDTVVRNAEGNPFFVEELIKMLIDDGLIVTAQDQWRLDLSRLAEVRVPSTLTGVLQARLDRLPTEERTIIQQASVVGRLFWDHAVVHINEASSQKLEPTRVLSTLSALRGREMVFQRETTAIAGAQEYIFKNALLREASYESVLKRLRKVYHGLVADWLMEQGGDRAGEYTSLIADHLELAGRNVEAIEYLLQTGDRARGLYAHQEALSAYHRALALLEEQQDYERAARTLMKLGLTYHTAFDFEQARQAYEDAFSLGQKAGQVEERPRQPAPHPLRVAARPVLTLDPNMGNDSGSRLLIEQLFRGLFRLTLHSDILPDMAASWEVSEGGRTYTFQLRDNVRWSDGVQVTARDFEYAWKRVLDPATGSRVAAELYDVRGARALHQGASSDPADVGVRALDDLTLEVELEAPTGYFLHLLASSATYPVPRHVVEAHGRAWTDVDNMVSNGPFTLRSWQEGQSVLLVRNPGYRGRFTGNVEQVELSFVGLLGGSVALQMYEADRLDVFAFPRMPMVEIDRVRQIHAGEYVSMPSYATLCLVFDVTRAPFDDHRIRRAFAHALDRNALLAPTPGGSHFPATGGIVPPGIPGHSPSIALQYDPAQARQLLAEAGYPGGHGFPKVRLLTWHRQEQLTKALLAQLRDNLGLDIAFAMLEWPEYVETPLSDRGPLRWLRWRADYPDPDSCLRVGLRRYSEWRNKTYDELVGQGRRVTDQAKRMSLYRQAERILVDEVAMVPVAYYTSSFLVKAWVRRFVNWPAWKDMIIEPH